MSEDGNLATFPEGRVWIAFRDGYKAEMQTEYPEMQVGKELGFLKRLVRQYGEPKATEYVEAFWLARQMDADMIRSPKDPIDPIRKIAMCKPDVVGFTAALTHIHEAAGPRYRLIVLEK